MKLKIIPKLILNLFKKPITVQFPRESIPIPEGYRGKHSFDPDKCLGWLCGDVCPAKAIQLTKQIPLANEKYIVD